MTKQRRHAHLSKTHLAPAEVSPSAFSSRPLTRQAPPPFRRKRDTLETPTWQQCMSSSLYPPRVGIINEASLNKTYLLGNRALRLHFSMDRVLLLTCAITSSASLWTCSIQPYKYQGREHNMVPQLGAIPLEHVLIIVLLAHHFAFEAIGGCARQKGTCTFSNAAVVSLLESPPWSDQNIESGRASSFLVLQRRTPRRRIAVLLLPSLLMTTTRPGLVNSKKCRAQKKKRVRDPCHATGIEDRRPADPTTRNAACFPIEITQKIFSV